MKKLLLTLALILGASAWAVASERTVSIYQADGQVVTFSFQDSPVVTYSGNDLVLTTTKTTVQYPIYMLRKLVFDEDWDYITDNIADELEPVKPTTKFGFQDGMLTIVGVDPGSSVRLFNLKGMLIGVYRVGSDGLLSISMRDLGTDVYIVKTNRLSFKFRKS